MIYASGGGFGSRGVGMGYSGAYGGDAGCCGSGAGYGGAYGGDAGCCGGGSGYGYGGASGHGLAGGGPPQTQTYVGPGGDYVQETTYLVAFGQYRHRAWVVGQRPHGC